MFKLNPEQFRITLVIGTLAVIGVSALMTFLINEGRLTNNRKAPKYRPGVSYEIDQAVDQAQSLFNAKKAKGLIDLTEAPCLTNDLKEGWVVDIVHTPRLAVDDLVKNQCQAFLEGRAKHIIELDIQGNVIKVN